MAEVKRLQTDTGASHAYSEEEKQSFVEHIDNSLKGDRDLAHVLPIDPTDMSLFTKCSDGLLLCKLINYSVPDTIDERALNLRKGTKDLNTFEKTENLNLCINSAKAIGCSVVNIGSQDIIEGRPYLILGLIWQIVRIGLLSKISLTNHPELFRLLEPGEDISDLLKLPPEQILLRWFNYHLKKANWPRRVGNFSGDIKDSENYTVLLNQIAPNSCSRGPLNEPDQTKRAEQVLQNADKIDCRKFVTPKDIVKGNPKLNLAFVANLFNTHPGLEPLSEEEKAALEEWLFASEGTREARAFCLWINSLGVEPFVNNLFEDLRDGLVLLRVMDKVQPGIVDWSKVNEKHPLNKFKKVENCNYAIVLGKQLKFSLVGIAGSDILDGNKTLTLALVWQLMRFHVISILKKLSSGGKDITDQDIVNWANSTITGAGKSHTIESFKDGSLRTSLFFIDLLSAIKPRLINYDLVTPGTSDEEATQNAKYSISIARKIGCTIFLLPEDIIEVKNKMIMTFAGTVMAVAQGHTVQ